MLSPKSGKISLSEATALSKTSCTIARFSGFDSFPTNRLNCHGLGTSSVRSIPKSLRKLPLRITTTLYTWGFTFPQLPQNELTIR